MILLIVVYVANKLTPPTKVSSTHVKIKTDYLIVTIQLVSWLDNQLTEQRVHYFPLLQLVIQQQQYGAAVVQFVANITYSIDNYNPLVDILFRTNGFESHFKQADMSILFNRRVFVRKFPRESCDKNIIFLGRILLEEMMKPL